MRKQAMFVKSGWDGKHVNHVPKSPRDPLFFLWMLGRDVVKFASQNEFLGASDGKGANGPCVIDIPDAR